MKVLFAYINSTGSFDMPMSIAYLSAVLKEHGFQTSLYKQTPTPNYADVLAITATTLEYNKALELAREWKQWHPDRPVVIGGPHATICPEEISKDKVFDGICRGEAEEAFLEWMQTLRDTNEVPRKILNFYPNQLRPLNEDLDSIPFPDRTIFPKEYIENHYPGTTFLTSRGCPFHCSMCINHYYQQLYRGLGKYTRFRSIDNLLEEIHQVVQHYCVTRLFFVDDTFTVDKARTHEFCVKYQERFDIPFMLMGRCNTVTQTMIQELKQARCEYIGFGIESGSERIRNDILKRGMTETQIVDAFKWAREADIRTASYNIIGNPTESRAEMMQTVELNRKAKPDVIQTTLLFPFPKTEIYEFSEAHGLLLPNGGQTEYYSGSIIKGDMKSQDLHALSVVIPLYVHFPKWLWWTVRICEWFIAKTNSHILKWMVVVFRKKVLERKFWKQMK